MERTEIKGRIYLKESVSKKTGNPYTCLEIEFPNGYVKSVFMDNSELFMMKSMLGIN